MGTDEESGWRASVDTEKWCRQRHGAGCTRSVETSCAIHADHRPRLAVRPGLRKDFTPLLRASGSACRRVCPGVVQADAPRYGSDPTLSRPARSKRNSVVARPPPRGGSLADRGAGHSWFEGKDPRVWSICFAVGIDG